MRKFLILSLLLQTCIFLSMRGQTIVDSIFSSPLNIPLFLAGNYGELRDGHFHAGLDLKTNGETGKPVFAAQDGYVSRIKVQITGYGRAIYITHPNGYTTVYGHLDHFIPELQNYMTQNQYDKHTYEVDLYPSIDQFVVKKGQQIAWSGNTGGSTGPHLHFEIRRSGDEVPVNRNLFVYSLPTDQSVGNNGQIRKMYQVSKQNDSLYTVPGVVVGRLGYIAFGAEVYDFLDGSSNKCGVYKLELFIDNFPEFSFTVDGISFGVTRFVDAHMDYELKCREHRNVHRLFELPNDRLPIYSTGPDHGILKLTNDSLYKGLIKATDAYGNRSYLSFTFRRTTNDINDTLKRTNGVLVKWDQSKTINDDRISIHFPVACLYRDIYFDHSVSGDSNNILYDTIRLHYDTEPLQKYINIQLNTLKIPDQFRDKLIFSRIGDDGKLNYEGGQWFEGKFTLFTRDFGNYVLKIDTVAPVITPVDFISGKKYSAGEQMVFHVSEDLSDIKDYYANINQEWALLAYDPRDQSLTYTVDKKYLRKEGIQNLKIIVIDNAGNVGTFEDKFNF